MTARDINQKHLDALKSKKVEFMESEPEKAVEWQEVIETQEEVFERIEESNLSPEEKEKLSQRIFLLFTDPGQYFVRGKSRPNEQGTLKVDINNEEHIEAAYQPNDGMILTVDKPSGYDEETYNNVAEVFGQEVANDLRDARSRWAKIASAAYQFGKGVLVISKEPLEAKPGFGSESVFELFIEALEDPRNEEVVKAGAELVHNIYEGLIELWENQQFQGGVKVVGGLIEVGIGKGMVVGGGVGSVITAGAGAPIGIPVAILGAAVAGHGVDQIGTGFTQILMNQEVPSVMAGAFEEMGFSPEDSRNMDMYFAMGIPFAASHQFLNIAGKSIELGFNAIRRTSQQSVPMFFKAGTCPRVIGLFEKEVYTATNPLKLKQIPVSLAKEFERGGSWIMTEEKYYEYFVNEKFIGRLDGQFMTSCKRMDQAIKESGGDVAKLEKLFSTKNWQGKTLYRIDVKNPLDYNPRIPHAGLSGANKDFISGGFTKGGIPEIVTDVFPKSQVTITKIN